MRVLVCGDRHWNDYKIIRRELLNFPKGTVVIHGNAKGADSIAGAITLELGLKEEKYDAEWDIYGKAAGPIRNRRMLHEGEPDVVLAFHKDIESSKGTKDMVSIARNACKTVKIIIN